MNLFAQSALTEGAKPTTQAVQGLISACELGAKTVDVPEDAVIDEADEAIEFQQRVLQRRGGQQYLGVNVRQRVLERLGDDIAGFVNVAQAMRFVEHDHIPVDPPDVVSLGLRKLIGADDRA